MSQPYNQPPNKGGYNPYNSPAPGVGSPYGRPGEPHRGTTILVLGILGLLMCPILGVIAWVMARTDMPKIESGQMDPEGRGTTQAGMICGIIATVLLVIQVLAVCAYFAVIFVVVGGAAAGGM